MQEKIIEIKQCKKCNISFDITNKDLEFYDKVSPIFNGKKQSIPIPTLCPNCRQQRRLVWRNERKLYKRKCDATGEDIISMYSPDKIYKIYNPDFWWSDKWDALYYGKKFDFENGFFEQFKQIMKIIPRMGLFLQGYSENSEYTNVASNNKNSYLIFSSNYCNNCLYGVQNNNCNDNIDCLNVVLCKNSYELVNSKNCYHCFFSQYLFGCTDCNFSINLEGCTYCYLCINLKNKKYCINNIQYTKDEYFKKINIIGKLDNSNEKKGIIVQNYIGNNNENCTGDYIFNSKDTLECFECVNCDNIKYCSVMIDTKDSMDYSYWGRGCYKIYESHGIGYNCSDILFSTQSAQDNSKLIYCDFCCNGSENLFGCIGLKNKSYCILNKQYTKEEYNILVPKIIEKMKEDGEWGEFFPSSMSPFGYNETVANEYFPLEKDEAVKNNFNWSDYESPKPNVEKIIPASKLPDNIDEIPDDILNWAIECKITKKPFRIIKQELEFYRKHNLPIPKRHPDQRHLDRMKLRNPRKLYDRDCDNCGINMKTTYNPNRNEIVYCEKCYNKEIY